MDNPQEHAERLAGKALALEPDKRKAFLDEACRGATELRDIVEKLLVGKERSESFPNARSEESNETNPVMKAGRPNPNPPLDETVHHQFRPGDILSDRFVIIRFVAKGGWERFMK